MNNNELNTFLLLLLFMAMCTFMAIWAYIGFLIIRGVRKSTRWLRTTKRTLAGFSALPVHSAAPLVRPAKYDRRNQLTIPTPMAAEPHVPILRRVSTIIYTKEY